MIHSRIAAAPLRFLTVLVCAVLLLASCSSSDQAAVEVSARAHSTGDCSGAFVAHDLPHLTKGPGSTSSTFDGTGAGVAAGDLDGDGDIDLVLPNLFGPTTIAENRTAQGEPTFEMQPHTLIEGRFRAAATVDVDGDEDLDIVLTSGIGPPVLFRNNGSASLSDRFDRELMADVRAATYAMAWADLGGDGDLDLITGSYNAELSILRNSPVLGSDTGVLLFEAGPDGFTSTRLSRDAQALAMVVADVNNDDRLDIVVGNDLATPDMIFLDDDAGWNRQKVFPTTSYSTMSYDAADLNGDGDVELFSTDMAPMSEEDIPRYVEVLRDLNAAPEVDRIQIPENVLLRQQDDGTWNNDGPALGVEATGWSWSGLFGDLDNDRLQDIFVVNGMRSDLLFDFLPDARLVEPNQAFRNTGTAMEPAPEWILDDTAGGRGVVQADLDGDGDLDIAINNLDVPSRVFENQLCGGGAITAELRWPGTMNVNALGATVTITADDITQNRMVASTRGYLSGAAPEVHFGLADVDSVDMRVRWPDGAESDLGSVNAGQHLVVTRTASDG